LARQGSAPSLPIEWMVLRNPEDNEFCIAGPSIAIDAGAT
jgi:hypothetical protein